MLNIPQLINFPKQTRRLGGMFFVGAVISINVDGQTAVYRPPQQESVHRRVKCPDRTEWKNSNWGNPRIQEGMGSSSSQGDFVSEPKVEFTPRRSNSTFLITSKPKANYTDSALENCVQGDVMLRIRFLSDGTIGQIKVIDPLPHGLSEQAIKAAKLITFNPEKKKGRPISIWRKVHYSFTIY